LLALGAFVVVSEAGLGPPEVDSLRAAGSDCEAVFVAGLVVGEVEEWVVLLVAATFPMISTPITTGLKVVSMAWPLMAL
jgi:hypothetical protein